jgi:hypothetical protein
MHHWAPPRSGVRIQRSILLPNVERPLHALPAALTSGHRAAARATVLQLRPQLAGGPSGRRGLAPNPVYSKPREFHKAQSAASAIDLGVAGRPYQRIREDTNQRAPLGQVPSQPARR